MYKLLERMQYTTLNDKITAMKTIMTYSIVITCISTRVSSRACKFIMLEIIDFTCIIIEIYLCSNYVVKKRHEQVEKTLEMKKWSRNGSSNETRYR